MIEQPKPKRTWSEIAALVILISVVAAFIAFLAYMNLSGASELKHARDRGGLR